VRAVTDGGSAASPTDRPRFDVDPHAPRPERVYNYLVGGRANFEADQKLGRALDDRSPVTAEAVRTNALALAAFMRRAVRYLAGEVGVRQFLNAGTPVPSGSGMHHAARQVASGVRFVYTSSDPVVLAHAHALRSHGPEAVVEVIHGSLRRRPERILTEAAETLDFSAPVAFLLPGYLNFVPDQVAAEALVARLLDAVAPGSHLVLAHSTDDVDDPVVAADLQASVDHLTRRLGWPYVLRSHDEIAALFGDLQMVEPGLVHVDRWRWPDGQPARDTEVLVPLLGGVARKP
jgi:hypothetical protein